MKMRKVLSMLLATLMLLTMIPLGAVASAQTEAERIIAQISSTYNEAKRLTGMPSFDGWCGKYVKYQLIALNITSTSDSDVSGNGNKMYGNIKAGTTSKGYTKTKYSGNNCIRDIVSSYSGSNVYNILVSWTYQYGGSNSNPGAGHATFIHAIINDTVYYSESYATGGKAEGSPQSCSVSTFYSKYNKSYGNAIGAVHFTTAHSHYHDKYVYYLAAHPHHKCYQCTCGDVAANYSTSTYVDTCEICNPPCSHTYDNTCDASCNQCGAVREVNDHTWTIATCSEAKTCTICGATEGAPLGHKWDITIKQCSVCGKKMTTEYSEWSENLPADITEDAFDIETKTVYRYRDNSSHVIYGEWSSEQTTSTKPTESDTLTIVSTTTYYNYYHICCNYYGGQNNVDSIEYGSGSHYRHTIRLTYELSAKNVADKGGKQLYGSYSCSKGFNVWAKADQYITYEYKYKTRTATNVVDYGTCTDWSETNPSAADNRNIETKTLYRYKIKHDHVYDDEYDPTCNECGVVRDVPEKPVEILYGDADGDGSVTVGDVVLLQQYLAEWGVTISEVAADADGDGSVTVGDVVLLQQYLAEWDVTLGG